MIRFFENIKEYFSKTREEQILEDCGCVCYCKNCHEPLNDTSDCVKGSEDGLYIYTCIKCSTESHFHFGIAPAPILVN